MAERDLRRGIREFLRFTGFAVWDLEQERPTRQTPGLADLFVAGHGMTGWLEIKTPKGRQSPAQANFEREVTAHGGFYRILRSLDDAVAFAREVLPDGKLDDR